ncbi:MAG: hypothetical protein BRD49_05970 [Bacteroidetes bacterium SW_10_40_5]|nr:MAG: hypothetical protein BRD49_05970 [Bacteroidetes bacterium SW_10_40_5]
MRIFQAFQHLRLTQDQENALKKFEGFLASDKEVFILKGYAGTGKTTMLDGLVKYLKNQGRSSHLFAPTGRAAKVLKEKTGEGSTIHRGIYNFEELECVNVSSKEDSEKSFHYYFPVNDVNETGRVCLVDEASMISSKQDRHELFSFGTDQLLADLLTFMKTGAGLNKIIFIGDPAQLPPVTDSKSYALSEDYFQGKAIPFDSCELKEVNRQKEGNTVLNNATRLRELLDSKKRANLQFDYDDQFVDLDPDQVVEQYVTKFPQPEIGNSVIISFSNAQCLHYNQWTRQKYFPEASRVQPGDILMINHNNYHTYGIELYNGDMAKVIEASDFTEKQSAEVKDYEGGHGIKKRITLEFRDLKLEVPGYSGLVSCKIIDSLLNSPERDLTIAEQKALYVNFNIRNYEANKKRRESGEKEIKEGSEKFKEKLKADPYFNALRVKYGYAVTCHKAQGGEWEQVFVNFRGRIGLKDDQLRWAYTAITRGSEKVYAINAPVFSHFSKLEFDETETISKVPEHAIQYNNIPKSPFHDKNAHPCKQLKYFEVQEKIKNTPYVLERIDSKPYHEIYWFSRAEQHCRVDAHHDKAGFFKAFIPNKKQDEDKKLLELLNAPYVDPFISVDYKPSTNELKELYSRVQFYCNELSILITNIEERLEEHFVRYFLQTDAQCALLQFYFDKNNRFGKALPKSKLGNKDERLSQLIEALSENKIPERSATYTEESGTEGYLNTGLVNEPETNYNASYNQSSNTEEKDLGQTGIAPDYQVEETVHLPSKNHGSQIKELRKSGDREKLKEAFNLADQDLKANPGGVWENRNMKNSRK